MNNIYLEKIAMRAQVRHILGDSAKKVSSTVKGLIRGGLDSGGRATKTDITKLQEIRQSTKSKLHNSVWKKPNEEHMPERRAGDTWQKTMNVARGSMKRALTSTIYKPDYKVSPIYDSIKNKELAGKKMSNIYLEKIAKRMSRARKLYDDGKEVYDEAKDTLEIKKKLTQKNAKTNSAVKVQNKNTITKKRMSASGRKWNRGTITKSKAK